VSSKLTPKQEKFCQLYVETGNASEAYRQAYNSNSKAAAVDAKKLLDTPKISLRVQDLQEALEEKALWRRIHSVKILAEIAQASEKDADRVSAVKALNAMHGWDKQVIDHTSTDGSMTPVDKVTIEVIGAPEHQGD